MSWGERKISIVWFTDFHSRLHELVSQDEFVTETLPAVLPENWTLLGCDWEEPFKGQSSGNAVINFEIKGDLREDTLLEVENLLKSYK